MVRHFNNNILEGTIVETEAYSQEEEACHGFMNKTESNKTLFGEPGLYYVYKTYGIHYCLNLVTDKNNFASGVLIRSVLIQNEPERAASGPGILTKRFGIDKTFDSLKSYDNNYLKVYGGSKKITIDELVQTTRIGISKARDLKWRWYLRKCRSISIREKGDKKPAIMNKNCNLSS